jgi:hypothetical protein
MSTAAKARPQSSEYAPYYDRYISKVPEGDIIAILERGLNEALTFIRNTPEARGTHRYAEGKWSIKEVIGHIIDGERVFAYRALRFGRNDKTPLPGFEQDDFIKGAAFDKRTLKDLAEEYEHVRRSTISLFAGLEPEAWDRRGPANDDEVSVRGIAYIIAGHERHHLEVLKEKYL